MEKLSLNDINQMKPIALLDDERVKKRFVNLFMNLHKTGEDEAENFFETEKYNFIRIISESEHLQQCTPFSIYGCFLDVARLALSLERGSQPLLYVLWGNAKVGDKWEKRASLEVSPYGELVLRMQAGQIAYADSPVIVYEGDTFRPIVNEKGQKICVYEAAIPRKSKNIIGAFIRLTRPDNSFDFYYMLPDDIERLKNYSHKKNKGKTNALYSSNDGQIDSGFLAAKVIKHAFKTFPKVRIGQFSKLQDEAQAIDYGLDEPIPQQERPVAPSFEQPREQPDNDPFGGAPVAQPQSIQVEDDDDVF